MDEPLPEPEGESADPTNPAGSVPDAAAPGTAPDPGGPSSDRHPVWNTEATRTLDDSILNLIRQMALAVGGMFVAFVVSEWISNTWMDGLSGWGALVADGFLFAVLGSVAIFITSARPIRRALAAQQEAVESYEQVLEERGEHHRWTAKLQSALDMAESDLDSFEVVGRALEAMGGGPAELLLADSSRAHLRKVAVDPLRGGPSCQVETPWSCPAVRRGRTMIFADSRELDACPRLRDRSGGPCAAMCVPVTVLGTPMGVLHTTAAAGELSTGMVRTSLEALAELAGSRIGILRAMATSELQATTDPLTGLLNRRSLEDRLLDLDESGTAFALAFCDLDHFKDLNDTYGHEAGDRALRCFARLLRATVREEDVVSRYGGEEFVVVLPGLDAAGAVPILERFSSRLAEAVQAGEVPELTVSVGVSDSLLATQPSDAIRQADGAMFAAKQAGRNRIVKTDPTDATFRSQATRTDGS